MNEIVFINRTNNVQNHSNDKMKKTHISDNPQKINNDRLLSNALVGLAIIGASALSSCSNDSILDELDEPVVIEKTDSTPHTATEKTDDFMNTLNLLENGNSINNISTFTFSDKGHDYYFEPIKTSNSKVRLHSVVIDKNTLKNSESAYDIINTDDGVDVRHFDKDNDTISIRNYRKEGDEIAEYKYVNGFKVGVSRMKKTSDGKIERTFSNDSTAVYNNIKNNEPMAEPITFDATIQSWYVQDNPMDLH